MGWAGFTNLTDFSKDDLLTMVLTWDQENAPRVLGLLASDQNPSREEKEYLRLKWDPLRKQRQQEKAARGDKATKKRKHKEDTPAESGAGDADADNGKKAKKQKHKKHTPAKSDPGDAGANNNSDIDMGEEALPAESGPGDADASNDNDIDMDVDMDVDMDDEAFTAPVDDASSDGEHSVVSTASGRYPMGKGSEVPEGFQGTHKTDDWSMGPDPSFPDHDFTGCLSGHEQVELQIIAENKMIEVADQEGTTYEPPTPNPKWDWREHMEKRPRRKPDAWL